jgi:spore maturation protein SpmA
MEAFMLTFAQNRLGLSQGKQATSFGLIPDPQLQLFLCPHHDRACGAVVKGFMIFIQSTEMCPSPVIHARIFLAQEY